MNSEAMFYAFISTTPLQHIYPHTNVVLQRTAVVK
jgi:hypothetical protein